ncbi:hypothetical protein ACFE04_028433 [Oxalis oulophora]
MALIVSVISIDNNNNNPSTNSDLHAAMQEMQKANYFTFVLLLNMSPFVNNNLGNLTFLMPNDKILSGITIPEHSVSDFLLLHSIPSPLLFDQLDDIPTGSLLPSSLPNFMLKIGNNGRRSYYINNVKIISPNICTGGNSIRCHGINGVITGTHWDNGSGPLSCGANSSSSSSPIAVMAAPPALSPAAPLLDSDEAPAAAPAPMPNVPNSGRRNWGCSELVSFVVVMVFTVGILVTTD